MFTKRGIYAALLFVVCFQCLAFDTYAAGKDERLEIKASDTSQLRTVLSNQKAEAVLTDGTTVSGRIKEVKDGSVVIDVSSSAGSSALPRGSQSIATERFNTLEIKTYKGKKRWILSVTLGAVGVLAGLAVLASEIDGFGGEGSANGTGAAVAVAAVAGGAAGGYALGRQLDKKRVTITIIK